MIRRAGSGTALIAAWALLSAAVTAVMLPAAASAHGLVGRSDLPLPDWLFAWGSSIVLIVSFVGLTLGWRSVRFEDYDWRAFGGGVAGALTGRAAADPRRHGRRASCSSSSSGPASTASTRPTGTSRSRSSS